MEVVEAAAKEADKPKPAKIKKVCEERRGRRGGGSKGNSSSSCTRQEIKARRKKVVEHSNQQDFKRGRNACRRNREKGKDAQKIPLVKPRGECDC